MKRNWFSASLTGLIVFALVLSGGAGGVVNALAESRVGFGFNAVNISGFPTGSVTLTGGGAYVPGSAFVHSAGNFRCTQTVLQGPLNTCLEGQGVRWDTAALLASSTFKCTGAAAEALKTATTSNQVVVLVADFYRQGDGDNESFTAKIIVSETDLAPDLEGIQNVWIQGVGCGSAIVNFN